MITQDSLKKKAAQQALSFVENNMKLGLGTGSTAEIFVKLLADRVAQGLKIVAVPTSQRTAALCQKLHIPLTTLAETPQLDLTIDGADEVDPNLQLIKGGGGALLREKIVAFASRKMVVIVDETKKVEALGAFPLPIEVNQFGWQATVCALKQVAEALHLEGAIVLRHRGELPFITDEGHYILDAHWQKLNNLSLLNQKIHQVPGVVEHGLFQDMADIIVMAKADGDVELLRR